MNRYRFRLESVLRVRRIEEDRAVAALAESLRDLTAAEERLERRFDAYRDAERRTESMSIEELLRNRDRLANLAASVVAAGTARLEASVVVDERRAEWSAAAMRVSALERLDERRRDEHRLEANRQEIIEADDMVIARAALVAR